MPTATQDPQLQLDALRAVGCAQVYVDTLSGAATGRPQLDLLLDSLHEGDRLVVWRLDRRGRSLQHLIGLVTDLQERGVQLRPLGESVDTTTATGRLVFHVFDALTEFRARPAGGAPRQVWTRRRPAVAWRPTQHDPDRVGVARQLLAAGKLVTEVARGRSVLATVDPVPAPSRGDSFSRRVRNLPDLAHALE